MTKLIRCDKRNCIFNSDFEGEEYMCMCRLEYIKMRDGKCEEFREGEKWEMQKRP